MTIAEALESVKRINRLDDNLRKLNQYFLNLDIEEVEAIANDHGIGMPIVNLLSETEQIIEHLAVRCQNEIMEAQLPEPTGSNIPFNSVFQRNSPCDISIT